MHSTVPVDNAYAPSSHCKHVSAVEAPVASEYVPAGQGAQLELFEVVEYVPGAQGLHTHGPLSVVAEAWNPGLHTQSAWTPDPAALLVFAGHDKHDATSVLASKTL